MKRAFPQWLVILSLTLSLPVCGGGSSSTSESGPTVPAPVPSTPAPEPTPIGDPPLSASCALLGMGVPDDQATCTDGPANFLDEVNDAISAVRGAHPEYLAANNFNVTNVGAYYVEVIRTLDRMGLCAAFDGEELGVKLTDDYNDQYDILSAKDEVRTGPNIYIGTCSPAIFPKASRPPVPVSEGCTLPPSDFVACGRPESRYFQDVEDAIDQLLVERPELFDFDDRATGEGWPALRDGSGYHDAMLDKLRSKGYCAIFDGEEIQMKQGSNEFSEHYDVNYQDKYIRRGNGIFRGSCYPAAF